MIELQNVILTGYFLIEQAALKIERVTGIFGPNGSGKSSVLDAIQIAMMGGDGNQLSLNAQAEDKNVRRSPRKIRDYVLGRYGVEEGQEVRENGLCYITLVFKDTVTGVPITMGVCLAAQRSRDGHETLGQYLLPGVELHQRDHVSTVDGKATPIGWPDFQVLLDQKARAAGVDPEEVVFKNSERFTEAYLLAMRSSHGSARPAGFRKAFRFALRMRFDQSVEDIVKTQVLEDRPVNIKKFKEVMDSFGKLRKLVEDAKAKIADARAVMVVFDRLRSDLRKAATWFALGADAHAEMAIAAHDQSLTAAHDATEHLERLRVQVDEVATNKAHAEGEVERLGVLIAGHEAHQKQGTVVAQLQEKVGELNKAKSGFKQGSTYLARLLESSAASGYLPEMVGTLREQAEKLDRWSGLEAEQASRDEARAVLGPPVRTISEAFGRLNNVLATLDSTRTQLQQRESALRSNLDRARSGRATLSDDVLTVYRALSDAGIHTDPVCDLVRVGDVKWQPAIEAYLGRNREALLISNPRQEEAAFDVYRNLPRVYGVKLVLPSQNQVVHTPGNGAVAELLVGENVPALVYLRSLLGSTVRATDSKAVKQHRALTPDGMLTSGGSLERLRPPQFLLLGGGRSSSEEVTHINRELAAITGELEQLGARMKAATGLQMKLGFFADATKGLDSVLASFDTMLAAQASVESLRRLVEKTADAEYTAMVEEQGRCKRLAAELGMQLSQLHVDFGKAQNQAAALEAEAQRKAAVAEAARAEATTLREHPDFDSQLGSKGWEQLDRECSSDLGAIEARAGEYARAASRSAQNAMQKSMNDLGEFARKYNEQTPAIGDEDEPWRIQSAWLDELLKRLEDTDLPSYQDQVERAFKTAQQTFRNDVALKINDNLDELQREVDTLNEVLRLCPPFSNGERYQFFKKVKTEHDALYKFVRAVGASAGEADIFSDEASLPKEFRALMEQSTEVGKKGEVTPLQDYREFFQLDIEILHEDMANRAWRRTTFLSKRLGPSSGGEHRAPLYVIAGASLASNLRIMKGAAGGMRLMMLDEAFDKMDDSNTLATLQYLESLGLQVLLAGPGKDIGVLNAFLHRYYEVSRDPENHTMSFAGHSVTEAARELNRSDRYEFFPELLEAEIRAMQAVEKPAFAAATAS